MTAAADNTTSLFSGLKAVVDQEQDVVTGRPPYKMTANSKGTPKTDPNNTRWIRSQLGHSKLAWAFLRGGKVVKISCIGETGYVEPAHNGEDNGPATVTPLTGRVLSTRLADSYFCYVERESKMGKKFKTEEWFPESDCQRALDEPEQLPFLRSLRGVTHTPLPRAGKGMLTVPGYDQESGFLYDPNGAIPMVHEKPTVTQVKEATARIRELFKEFVWAGDHDEANYLGGMLTPLMRLACPPPYKMVLIGAHQRGSGKSLLAQQYRTVHGGTLRSWPGTEEELKKQITAVLATTTAPVCQIDNIRGIVRSATLDALLTSADYTDRVLGSTNDTTMRNDRLWVATGNNMVMGGDLDRRTVNVMIDPGVERPEDRTDFAIKDLSAYVAEKRTLILADLLTMLAAWDAEGRPADNPTADSFGTWVASVRGVLGVCEVPGTFDHHDSRTENVDPDAEEAAAFLSAIEMYFGKTTWTVKDITEKMVSPDDPTLIRPSQGWQETDPMYQARMQAWDARKAEKWAGTQLAEAFPTAARGKMWRHGHPNSELTKPLGYWLRHRVGQWFGGRRVEKASDRKDVAEYRVVRATSK